MNRTTRRKGRRPEPEIADPQGMVGRIIRARTGSAKKDPEPRRIPLRINLDEEDFKLLEEDALHSHRRNLQWHAEVLLKYAVRASWAYDCPRGDIPGVTSARDFFSGLRDLQVKALQEIERAGYAAQNAAREAATRCQHYLDAVKSHRADTAGGKKAPGKRGSVRKAATS